VDELERLIIYSTMDNLPLVLSRAIPLLFAELRTVRATLDARVNSFLEGFTDDSGAEGGDSPGIPDRDDAGRGRADFPVGIAEGTAAVPGGDHQAEDLPKVEEPKRRRGRPKKGSNQGFVDDRPGPEPVGGQIPVEAGDAGILPISGAPRVRG
jgi:hypothetical protein